MQSPSQLVVDDPSIQERIAAAHKRILGLINETDTPALRSYLSRIKSSDSAVLVALQAQSPHYLRMALFEKLSDPCVLVLADFFNLNLLNQEYQRPIIYIMFAPYMKDSKATEQIPFCDEIMITTLLKKGLNPNLKRINGGQTAALHQVLLLHKGDREKFVRLLLEHGADPLACSPGSNSPFMYALKKQEFALAEQMIEYYVTHPETFTHMPRVEISQILNQLLTWPNEKFIRKMLDKLINLQLLDAAYKLPLDSTPMHLAVALMYHKKIATNPELLVFLLQTFPVNNRITPNTLCIPDAIRSLDGCETIARQFKQVLMRDIFDAIICNKTPIKVTPKQMKRPKLLYNIYLKMFTVTCGSAHDLAMMATLFYGHNNHWAKFTCGVLLMEAIITSTDDSAAARRSRYHKAEKCFRKAAKTDCDYLKKLVTRAQEILIMKQAHYLAPASESPPSMHSAAPM